MLIKKCNFAWSPEWAPNLHAVNPYSGCSFACHYCWSRALSARFGKKQDWTAVEVAKGFKHFWQAKLMHELVHSEPMTLLIGSTSDPMPNIEQDEMKTRTILEVIKRYIYFIWEKNSNHKYLILTKNPDIVEYAPLLKNIGAWAGMTLTASPSYYETVRDKYEPGAPHNGERVEALRELHKAGVKVFASIEPWLCELTTIEYYDSAGATSEPLTRAGFYDYTNPLSIIIQTRKFVDYYIIGSWNHAGKPLKTLIPHYQTLLPHVIETLQYYKKAYWIKPELQALIKEK